MSEKILVPNEYVWAWNGDKPVPTPIRFEFGNESGVSAEPPRHEDHNYIQHRSSVNQQAILREGVTDYDANEVYEPFAVYKQNGRLAQSTAGGSAASTNNSYAFINDAANVSTATNFGTFRHTVVGNVLTLTTS